MSMFKQMRNRLFAVLYRGNRYYCVYCKQSFRRFMHEGLRSKAFKKNKIVGGGYKRNCRCPNCMSTDRARLLYLFFHLRTSIFKAPVKILHIAPNAHLARVLYATPAITYVCGALDPEEFREFNAVKVDVTQIDFVEHSFDVVICNHVLEHVPDDLKAMHELWRVLKPGGYAVLQVPLALNLLKTLEDDAINTDKKRKIMYGQPDHIRLYGLDYFALIESAGFTVVRDNPFANKWSDDLAKHRLDLNEDVIIAYKKQNG